MTTSGTVNGIETPRLNELVEAILANPRRALTHWSARVEWSGRGTASSAHIRHFPPLPFDEPPALAGADAAPNPVEQILAALGACLTTTFVVNASLQGIPLESVEADLHGDLDLRGFLGLSKTVNPGYDSVQVELRVRSPASAAQIEALARRAEETCPISAIFQRNVAVKVALTTAP
ncbi:MAG: OsmC family protein [Thermoplasmata archaeon]